MKNMGSSLEKDRNRIFKKVRISEFITRIKKTS